MAPNVCTIRTEWHVRRSVGRCAVIPAALIAAGVIAGCGTIPSRLVHAERGGQRTSQQTRDSRGAAPERSVVWPAVRRVLFPPLFSQVYDLRNAIASTRDTLAADRIAHLRRVDAIFETSVLIAEGDVQRALLLCAIATLPYRTFPAIVPLVSIVIDVRVSTESRADFARRYAALPSRLFADSPPGGDRDKLTHFFGSAWLESVFHAPALVNIAGESVELGEALFKLEGFEDARDEAVNRLGAVFGDRLLRDPDVLPSAVLFSKPALR